MAWLQATDPQLLFTKNDPSDPRLGEWIEIAKIVDSFSAQNLDSYTSADQIHILGYPDDEGIANGGGRTGAHKGPASIRQSLYKMTPDLKATVSQRMTDWGDLELMASSLEVRHQRGREIIKNLCAKNQKFLTLGGGHDYGYSDGAGFLDHYREQALIINLDAHLDVRPMQSKISSGTPFFRLLSDYPGSFEFFEFGLQAHCNSRAHLDWAKQRGAQLFLMDEMRENFQQTFEKALTPHKNRKVFLSIDIDAFTSTEAPGCSQSWVGGLEYKHVRPALQWLYEHFDVRGLGIYEVAPPLDVDSRTSKLAALLAHQFIFSRAAKK